MQKPCNEVRVEIHGARLDKSVPAETKSLSIQARFASVQNTGVSVLEYIPE